MKTLYRASRVVTLAHPALGEWILVDDRHVQRVGSGEAPTSEADRVVDLPGATIVPGFIDAHVHLTGVGVHGRAPEVAGTRSARDLVDVLTRIADERSSSVLVHGYDESAWGARELPSLAELDAVASEPMIVVRADGHTSLANTAALRASGALELPGVETGDDGQPTGVARTKANDRLQRWYIEALPDAEVEQLQLEAAALAASRGITCVHEMSIPEARGTRDVEVLVRHRAQLPVDVVPYVATTEIPLVMDLGLTTIGGDLSLDGSIGARTAHVSQPYVDGDGAHDHGVAYFETGALTDFLQEAHAAGLQVGLHAIGDEAIEQALDAWERVVQGLDTRLRRHFRARGHRLEHFEMPTTAHIERVAMLGVALSVQPAFDAAWGHPGQLYEQRLGESRAALMNPFRTLLDHGIVIGAGSDAPITPLDAMDGIDALEAHHDATQRLTRDDALRLFTTGGARLAHQESKKGRLQPGMHADFAAYPNDPTTAPTLADLRPILTVSLGREVFAS